MNCARKPVATDEWQYLGEYTVMAEAAVHCAECCRVIHPGTEHILHLWRTGGGESSAAVCMLCQELRETVCVPFGQARETLRSLARTGRLSYRFLDGLSPRAREEVADILDGEWRSGHAAADIAAVVRPGMTRAEISRIVISAVIARVGREDEARLRDELRAAYPFGARTSHPHRVWRREIRNILGPAPVQSKRS